MLTLWGKKTNIKGVIRRVPNYEKCAASLPFLLLRRSRFQNRQVSESW